MDSCIGVEQDLDKALTKFNTLNDHTNRVLQDIIDQVEDLRKDIANRKSFSFPLFVLLNLVNFMAMTR